MNSFLKMFASSSGLIVNKDKTEVLGLGQNQVSTAKDLNLNEIKTEVKILGIYFTYDHLSFRKLNFDSIVKAIKSLFNMWKRRGLTLLGKIQIIKSFAVPKILYRLALLPVNKDIIREINTLLFEFVWNGKDKASGFDTVF
jgi:hypothetical protein